MFWHFSFQSEDGQWKVPKHIVVTYIINIIFVYISTT